MDREVPLFSATNLKIPVTGSKREMERSTTIRIMQPMDILVRDDISKFIGVESTAEQNFSSFILQ